MTDMDILLAVGAAVGSGVAAEFMRLLIPGTKHDSKAVKILGVLSKLLTLGATAAIKTDGRRKK